MKQLLTQRLRPAFFIGIGLSLMATSGCRVPNNLPPGAGDDPVLPPPPVVVPPAEDKATGNNSALIASITTDKKSYGRGQIVHFTLTLRNTSKSARKLNFNTSQSFDITATPAGKTEVSWRWSQGKMFTMSLRGMTLRAGEARSWTATWEQTDNDGNPLVRGDYSIVGRITANGGIETQPLTITLTDG